MRKYGLIVNTRNFFSCVDYLSCGTVALDYMICKFSYPKKLTFLSELERHSRALGSMCNTINSVQRIWHYIKKKVNNRLCLVPLLVSRWRYELTSVTLTSKNAVTPLDQKPPALVSNYASELVTALLKCSCSLSRDWRRGSIFTLLQTLSINAVNKSRSPSCLCPTKPPFLHERVWPTVNLSPHTHLVDRLEAKYTVSVASLWTPAY